MLRELIASDFTRSGIPKVTLGMLFRIFVISPHPGLKFMTIFRVMQHFRRRNRMLFYIFFVWYRNLKYKYGIDISYRTTVGKGLYIGHFGGITIHGDAVIGDNCNLSQGITIGVMNRGKSTGVPKLGSRVFVGPGAVIMGGIAIGDDVIVGPNAVVNFDVDNHSVVAASLATVISKKGTSGYIVNLS